ncbi:hypothetical protein B9T31_12120 [Acinetobacter sp. ANC 4558]|nr:hypothetical protein B9T31_12120 [Acinetobacter sp. ANC 4558]
MNMMSTLNLRAVVTADNGEPTTTSYAVGQAFNKRHSDVLRAIKNMKCSQKFRERNFAFTLENKQIGNTKRNTGFYTMTERGFMFLVIGFNGEKADAIKESFIDACLCGFHTHKKQKAKNSQFLACAVYIPKEYKHK